MQIWIMNQYAVHLPVKPGILNLPTNWPLRDIRSVMVRLSANLGRLYPAENIDFGLPPGVRLNGSGILIGPMISDG